MGFLSFNEKYYEARIKEFEGKELSENEIHEAKQLLKVTDDLADEGYTELNELLEKKYGCITRLKGILSCYNEKPFEMPCFRAPGVCFGEREYEIEELSDRLLTDARGVPCRENAFLREIGNYCRFLGYDKDTAYVFLLRDAMLPFLYFKSRGGENLYPWLISRAFLEDVTGVKNLDDEIRRPIYEALEEGISEYGEFKEFCGERMRGVLKKHPALEASLKGLLGEIREEKIIIAESGYSGTIPLLLCALDERADFRMYTTAPFLYEIYREKIFCRRYENIRLFETLFCQDVLMKYSSFRNGKFFVRTAKSDDVLYKALGEIKSLT